VIFPSLVSFLHVNVTFVIPFIGVAADDVTVGLLSKKVRVRTLDVSEPTPSAVPTTSQV